MFGFSYYVIFAIVILIFIFCGAVYNKLMGFTGSYSYDTFFNNNVHQRYFKQPKSASKGEDECRKSLQLLFNRPFYSQRPNFLQNPVTGGNFNLELDCYDEDLRLAVEYNGIQHYKYIPYFHKNYEAFLNQKYRDDMKRRICIDNNIILIEVPYTVKLKDIYEYIRKECISFGIL
jgi:hypothetical protein